MWLIAVALGVPAISIGGVSLVVWQCLHPARFTLRSSPADVGLGYEDVGFSSRDGLNLSGWWVPTDKPLGTVVLCHGYPSDRRDMIRMIPFLHKAGFNVLAFDFRRLGKSGGDLSTVGLREPNDLLGAVDLAAQKSDAPITAMGWSMGAATCIMAAARDARIRSVVADSPYRSLDVQTVRRFGAGPIGRACGEYAVWLGERILKERLSGASPLDSARQLGNRRLLLIHSRNDRLIPVADSEAIFEAARGPRELWVTDASGHIRSFEQFQGEYERRVLRFLGARTPGAKGVAG